MFECNLESMELATGNLESMESATDAPIRQPNGYQKDRKSNGLRGFSRREKKGCSRANRSLVSGVSKTKNITGGTDR
jgi:hypothetical protein